MRRLFRYLKGYEKETILAPLFKMLEAVFELLVPLVTANIVDMGIRSADTLHILKMGGFQITLGIIGLICSVTAQYFAAKAAAGFARALRGNLFHHINAFSYTEIDEIGTATLITRMTSDVNQVQSCVNMALRLLMRSPFIVVGAMVMAFTVDVRTALIFVVAIPVLSVLVFGIMAVTMPLYKKVQKQLDCVMLKTRENLSGVRVIRAFHKEEEEKSQYEEATSLLYRIQMLVGRISALLNPLTYVIVNLALAAILWVGGKEVYLGRLTQGSVIALVNYMSQILVELVKFANLIVIINRGLACAGRLADVLEAEPSIADSSTAGKTVSKDWAGADVQFSHVSFAYKGAGAETLSNIDFHAKAGQTIGIIGGTGCGKSSLVNLIPRFYDVSEGQVLIRGRDVRDYSLKELREEIGIVPQKAVLFKGSLRENMQFGQQNAADKEIWDALQVAQAKEFVEKTGQGLDYPIAQNGKNLSGGQRQRLTIARALVRKPAILILDDSASALDFATDAKLRHALKENMQNATVFLVSQRASTIRYADQILVLDDGRLVGCGQHEELYESCPLYREICQSQEGGERHAE